jgi:HSP20 family molecular chaperone IbpA
MALFAQFPSSEFGSLFRLLDDYDIHRSGRGGQTTIRAFRPKFDVRELKDSYELHGELPGVDQKDVNIEFVDPHTLVITGRVEHDTSRGNVPAAIADNVPVSGRTAAETEKPTSSHKAAVKGEGSGDGAAKPSSPAVSGGNAPAESAKGPEYQYWVSERFVGEFHRSFCFPSRVNQDAVKANLKNGVLSITVPKLTAQAAKKIRID